MGVELKDILVKKKEKFILKNISFSVENKDICGLIITTTIEKKALLKAFKDGKNLKTGNIILNKENITTQLAKKRALSIIYPQKLLFSLISIPRKLTSLYLKNKDFATDAKQEYRNAKYHYQDLIDNDINLDKKNFKNKLREFNTNFLKSNQLLEDIRIEKYLSFIRNFHELSIDSILEDIKWTDTSIIKQSYLSWASEQEKLVVANSRLTFLQALWDKFFLLTKLENSCQCHKPYKVKNKKQFKMKEVLFTTNEFLKSIEDSINEIRKIIRQTEIDSKIYSKNFWHLIKNTDYDKKDEQFGHIKKTDKFKKWKKFTQIHHNEFYFQQSQIITEILANELEILKGYVMNATYDYHQLLLSGFAKENLTVFKKETLAASLGIVSARNKAWVKVMAIIDNLQLKSLKFRYMWQFSSWDRLKLQLVMAVIQQKKLVIIDDTLTKKTKQYKSEFEQLIKKMQVDYKMTVLIISAEGYHLLDLAKKFVILDQGIILQQDSTEKMLEKPFNTQVLKLLSSPYLNWFNYFNYKEEWLVIDNNHIINLKALFDEKKNFNLSVAILPEKILPTFAKHHLPIINKKPITGWIIKIKKMRKGDWLLDVILNDNKIIKVITKPLNNDKYLKTETKFDILSNGLYIFDSKTDSLIKRC